MAKSGFPVKTTVFVSFVVGIASAPYVKPVLRIALRASVAGAIRAKRAAARAGEEFQDIVAEATASQSDDD